MRFLDCVVDVPVVKQHQKPSSATAQSCMSWSDAKANEVDLYVEGEEMMSCLTEETRQTAPRFAHDEERNCRVEGRRTVLKTCIA